MSLQLPPVPAGPAPRIHANGLSVLSKQLYLWPKSGGGQETPQEMFWRVAYTVAGAERVWGASEEQVLEVAGQFYEMMVNGYFIPNTPTMVNAGKPNGQLAACFVLGIQDSTDSIYATLRAAALVQTSGGGTGFSGYRLRCRNSLVGTTGKRSGGSNTTLRLYDASSDIFITQGSARKGANMWTLPAWHGDLLEFIDVKTKDGEVKNFNVSVGAPDAFMEAAEKREDWWLIDPKDGRQVAKVNAGEVMDKIIYNAWLNAEPGLLFLDRANLDNPTPQLGPLMATNPCLAGDTLVSTDAGLIPLSEVVDGNVGKSVIGPDGKYHDIIARYNQGERDVFDVSFSDGRSIKATADHKWPVVGRGKITTEEMAVGDELAYQPSVKYVHNDVDFRRGELIGWLIGDGYLSHLESQSKCAGIIMGIDDNDYIAHIQSLLVEFTGKPATAHVRKQFNTVQLLSYVLWKWAVRDMGIVPHKAGQKDVPECILRGSPSMQAGFLRGLFSADGHVTSDAKHGNYHVRLSSKSEVLCDAVQTMLSNLGVASRKYNRSRAARSDLFNHRRADGTTATYGSDGVLFEVQVSRLPNLARFADVINFTQARKAQPLSQIVRMLPNAGACALQVVSIEPCGAEVVYDITVEGAHVFSANGIITSNCGEQWLLDDEACTLGHLNVAMFVGPGGRINWTMMERYLRLAVRFLDNVVEINHYPLPQIEKMHKFGNRKIGSGFLGWADALVAMNMAYDSTEARGLAETLSEFHEIVTDSESVNLAQVRGSFANFKGSALETKFPKGIRNACRRTWAPTGSTSIVIPNGPASSGCEPLFGLVIVRNQAGMIMNEVNPTFQRYMDVQGLSKTEQEAVVKHVVANGTVRGAPFLPQRAAELFTQANEVSMEGHVLMQAALQTHVDNSISKTINLHKDATVEDVRKAYWLAWRSGCKGITVYRDQSRSGQVLSLASKSSSEIKEGKSLRFEPQSAAGISSAPGTSGTHTMLGLVSKPAHAPLAPMPTEALPPKPAHWNKKKLDECPNCQSRNIDHGSGCFTCLGCGTSLC